MRIVHALLTVAAVLTAGSPTPPDPGMASDIQVVAEELGLPGVAFRVVSEDEVLEDVEYGVDGDGVPIDESTPFVWGSVSKSVTAATVYSLASQHRLDLSRTVNSILPEVDSIVPGDVTIDDLIHHTSGLPHEVSELDVWGRFERALDVVPTLDVTVGDRGTFRYSSLNYQLLQAIVEKVTAEPFADVVARETGMHTAGAVTPGHVPFFTFPRSIDTGIDSAGLGYGYLSGSIDELSRYASRQLAAPASNSSDTVPTGSGTAYGYGWYVETLPDGTEMRWHSGAVPGYFTHVALVPERHLAVVFATNRYGELDADNLASAARSLVLTRLGIDEPRAAGLGLYEIALIGSTALAMLLAICAARTLLGFGAAPGRWALARVLTALGAGGLLYYSLPALAGAPISTLARWAPDIALLFWILLAELAVIAVALGARVFRQWTTAHV
ncbi:serine hydrolase [Rhodococcus sp. IEGM 1401]|uniref:serine hydrolase domain-containing protein n=1 Tax=unclassified Rhodococcus (in: high G+C Gram-positive bacteria) TaxID=192944 RepID=UPI0022B365C4|nr:MULTISPECIES: serine hydrolase domain-containing protein [unclassified Rhodococcus (in: high G+C Gram-positive bacteria)]MCZ4562801.1 serine hydrolase [Rhodococcus sp. IEGM 1401]MDI9922924.1 serine hydrolase domain-containing protein [Rhodococcus sp. IEGM 1372]MDV8035484.1 serine hydrolase domain-containing protein [Rhodococcus sp. IEGM 1414]